MTDLALLSALELAQAIRQGTVSPLDVTTTFLEQIEQHNETVGAFCHVAAETALSVAKLQTEQLAQVDSTDYLPPFFGVPTAIKDLNQIQGMPTSYGVATLRDKVAEYDDGVVMRLKQAGFNFLGKTTTSQLGTMPYTEPPGFLPSRNPWHLDHTAGGSSGGAAAAVAAGFCPIAQGSDGGGSLRGPGSCCGLVGFKPSRGRVSFAPVGDFQSGIASNGPLSRTVLDAAALLDVMAGYMTGDPYWLPKPDVAFWETAQKSPRPLRLAYHFSMPPFSSTATVQHGVKTAIAKLETAGHHLEEACFDASALVEPFSIIWKSGVGASGLPLQLLETLNQWLGEESVSAGDYLRAVQTMHVLSRQIVGFMEQYDALILPVFSHQPPKVGEWSHLKPVDTVQKIIEWIAPCPPSNAAGLPAIAIPVGFDDQGLPLSVQIVGKPAADATVLALAHQLEQLLKFPRQLPALFE